MTGRSGTGTMRKHGAVTAALAGLAVLPVLLAGCSGGGGGDGAGPTASPSAAADTRPSAAELGDCMRDKGYDVDDSEVGGSGTGGGARLAVPEGVDPAKWSDDLIACAGSTGAGEAPAAQPIPGNDELLRKTAACIRDGGFPDYPDDLEDRRRWEPGDADAFDRVARDCDDEVFGDEWERVG